ncbi:MAG: hypothetical protein CSA22_00670 [Deltaproteobacteria bacterium]|nr:MAG: hypothetical protein CSA22_00670 [Deltaproteobacteria bacterium]
MSRRVPVERRTGNILFVMLVLLTGFAGMALASSGGGHGAEGGGWQPTDTYRVMNFAVLAVALFLVARKPVATALRGRIDGIREELARLEHEKAEAEKTLAEYAEKIARMEAEAASILAGYVTQGEAAKARILEAAATAAEKMQSQAKRNLDNEILRAKAELKASVIAQSLEQAEAMVKENIGQTDQDRLVDDYLDKVVA